MNEMALIELVENNWSEFVKLCGGEEAAAEDALQVLIELVKNNWSEFVMLCGGEESAEDALQALRTSIGMF